MDDWKQPWAVTPAVHSFPSQPDMAHYARLIEDFAARGARPA